VSGSQLGNSQSDSRGDPRLRLSTPYQNRLTIANRLGRAAWSLAYWIAFRYSPHLCHFWRRAILRCFGARVGKGANPYPSCRIWAPWNLQMEPYSCLAPYVDCYNVAPIRLGAHCTVSQYAHLCGATHDYTRASLPLVRRPIELGSYSWVAAGAFIGPGVNVGEGAVVGAMACVTRDVEPWTVVAGNPARLIKRRAIVSEQGESA